MSTAKAKTHGSVDVLLLFRGVRGGGPRRELRLDDEVVFGGTRVGLYTGLW